MSSPRRNTGEPAQWFSVAGLNGERLGDYREGEVPTDSWYYLPEEEEQLVVRDASTARCLYYTLNLLAPDGARRVFCYNPHPVVEISDNTFQFIHRRDNEVHRGLSAIDFDRAVRYLLVQEANARLAVERGVTGCGALQHGAVKEAFRKWSLFFDGVHEIQYQSFFQSIEGHRRYRNTCAEGDIELINRFPIAGYHHAHRLNEWIGTRWVNCGPVREHPLYSERAVFLELECRFAMETPDYWRLQRTFLKGMRALDGMDLFTGRNEEWNYTIRMNSLRPSRSS